MKYLAFDSQTDKLIQEDIDEDYLKEIMKNMKYESSGWYMVRQHSCKSCGEYKEDTDERSDWYGIFTGHYCEDCYENDYPYKKERYPTQEYDGYGENLE